MSDRGWKVYDEDSGVVLRARIIDDGSALDLSGGGTPQLVVDTQGTLDGTLYLGGTTGYVQYTTGGTEWSPGTYNSRWKVTDSGGNTYNYHETINVANPNAMAAHEETRRRRRAMGRTM